MAKVVAGITGVTGPAAEVVRQLRTRGITDADWQRLLGDSDALELMVGVCRAGLDLNQPPYIGGYRPRQAYRLGLMLAGSGADAASIDALVQYNLGNQPSLVRFLGRIEPRQAWALVLWYGLDSTRNLERAEAARLLDLTMTELESLVAQALAALRPHVKLPPD
jgi:hypothetical protein